LEHRDASRDLRLQMAPETRPERERLMRDEKTTTEKRIDNRSGGGKGCNADTLDRDAHYSIHQGL